MTRIKVKQEQPKINQGFELVWLKGKTTRVKTREDFREAERKPKIFRVMERKGKETFSKQIMANIYC